MVQVRQQSHITPAGDIDLELWLQQLPITLEPGDAQRLLFACHMTQEAMALPGEDTGDWAHQGDCFKAGLDIAQILAELQVGFDCLVAGILYRAVRERRVNLETVATEFGPAVVALISGVTRMAAIGE